MSRVFSLFILSLVFSVFAAGQDLGSGNKLFGGDDKKPAAPVKVKPRKAPVKKAAAPKKAPAAAKRSLQKQASPSKAAAAKRTSRKETADPSAAAKVASSSPKQVIIDPAAHKRPDLIKKPASNEKAADKRPSRSNDERTRTADAKADPVKAREMIADGDKALDGRKFAFAEDRFRKALAASPDNTDAELKLSRVLSFPVPAADLGGRYEESEKLARSVISKDPSNAAAYDRLGVALEMRGLISTDTEGAYKRAIALDPNYAPAYAHLARLRNKQGIRTESSSLYTKAAEHASSANDLVSVAEVMQSDQRFADSMPLLNKAVALEPRNAAANALLGRAQLVAGDNASAERSLKRGRDLDPDSFYISTMLFGLYIRQGNNSGAESVLDSISRSAYGFEREALAGQFEQLGDAYGKSGRNTDALRIYKRALTFDPARESVLIKLRRK